MECEWCSFRPRPLCIPRVNPPIPLNRNQGGRQNRSGRFGEGIIFSWLRWKSHYDSLVAQPVAWLLYRLSRPGCVIGYTAIYVTVDVLNYIRAIHENLYKSCWTEVKAVINQATWDLFQPLLIFKTIDHVLRAYHCRPWTKDLINMYRVHSELLHQECTNCGPYPQVINLMLSDEPIINVIVSMKFSKSVSCTIWRCVLC